MPVTDVTTDPEALTMTLTAEFAAPVERLWQAFTDPRQLERFWGPPGYPATFGEFDFTVGGTARYRMTSPQGEQYHGAWEFLAIDEPGRIEILDVFTDADGNRLADMPTSRMVNTFEATDAGRETAHGEPPRVGGCARADARARRGRRHPHGLRPARPRARRAP